MHRRHSSKLAVIVLGVLAVAACGSGRPGDIALSWRFDDGRDCVDAAVFQVVVTSQDGPLAPVACSAGTPPASIDVATPPSGGSITVEAQSFAGAVLYDGAVDVPAQAAGAFTATLRYRGG